MTVHDYTAISSEIYFMDIAKFHKKITEMEMQGWEVFSINDDAVLGAKKIRFTCWLRKVKK